jgi:hypothetical protein
MGDDPAFLEWAAAGVAVDGVESGDLHVVAEHARGALLAVIDGLGHGPEAAAAAREGAAVLRAHSLLPLEELFERCHEAMRQTRGAVMTLVALDAKSSSIDWCGVGNVDAVLLRAESGRRPEAIASRGGVVGYRLPPLSVKRLPVANRDLLVLATDGIRSGFAEAIDLDGEPQFIADGVLAGYAKGTDDALVLVARYTGAVP